MKQSGFSSLWQSLATKIIRENGEPPLGNGGRVGVVAYKRSSNIGDDVQTVAILQNLPSNWDVVPIDREELVHGAGEPIKCIVNGWFMDDPTQWPPHESLDCLFVGFHVANTELYDEKFAHYYQSLSSLGCRDEATVEEMQKLGVNAYWSGCPTLCLKPPQKPNPKNQIEVVDAHTVSCDWHVGDSRKLLDALNLAQYESKVKISSHRLPFWLGRRPFLKLHIALRKLQSYAESRIIITNRLHTALPTLAMGTPVAFLHENPSQPRIESFTKRFQYLNPESLETLFSECDNSPSKMPLELASLRDDLRLKIRNFLGQEQ